MSKLDSTTDLTDIKKKIIFSFMIFVIAIGLIGILGWIGMNYASGRTSSIVSNFPKITGSYIISEKQSAIKAEEGMLLNQELDKKDTVRIYLRISKLWEDVWSGWELVDIQNITDEKEKELWLKFIGRWNKWKDAHEVFLGYSKRLDSFGYRNRHLEGRSITEKEIDLLVLMGEQNQTINEKRYSDCREILQKITDLYMNEKAREAKKTTRRILVLSIILFLIVVASIGAAVIYALVTSNSINVQNSKIFTNLAEMNQRLKQLDKLKDHFLANTSHELRTPLNGIIGLADSLLEDPRENLSNHVNENLGLIVASGRRLANLVNDILDFSRLNNADIELQLKPIGIRVIVDMVLTLSKPLVGKKELKLMNRIPSVVPTVLADENRVQQIIYNLVGNAIKFTETGTVIVRSRAEGNFLRIFVTDTGIGIDKEHQKAIFNSFTQADGSTSRRFGGTGLGLSITKSMVELHNGSMDISSEPGAGSVFSFTLPISGEESRNSIDDHDVAKISFSYANESAEKNNGESGGPGSQPLFSSGPAVKKPYSVLIVDDEPVNIQVLSNILSMRDFRILQATNGKDAINLIYALEELPSILLLDVMMPDMSGYEVCAHLRGDFTALQLPIILLTAKNQVENLVEGFDSGANDYLTKPFSKKELLSRIETQLMICAQHKSLKETARLKSEMRIAERIQTSIVPDPPEHGQLEIAAAMFPAENVGGDYYDILEDQENHLWLAIGDVTGHGLTAGLIMMMAQAFFTSCVSQFNNLSPKDMIISVNKLLFKNVQGRLKKDYFMTMTFMKYLGEGNFLYAGVHLDIIVYREKTASCELFKTAGVYLNVLSDISAQTTNRTLKLDRGDILLLYTDGVIEAHHKDSRILFDMDNLQKILTDSAGYHVEQIKQTILDKTLEWCGHKPQDDITLMVIKRKMDM